MGTTVVLYLPVHICICLLSLRYPFYIRIDFKSTICRASLDQPPRRFPRENEKHDINGKCPCSCGSKRGRIGVAHGHSYTTTRSCVQTRTYVLHLQRLNVGSTSMDRLLIEIFKAIYFKPSHPARASNCFKFSFAWMDWRSIFCVKLVLACTWSYMGEARAKPSEKIILKKDRLKARQYVCLLLICGFGDTRQKAKAFFKKQNKFKIVYKI